MDVKNFLHSTFKIKDLGSPKYFLSLKVVRPTNGIHVFQRKYILDLLSIACLRDVKPCNTLMHKGIRSRKDLGFVLPDPTPYK